MPAQIPQMRPGQTPSLLDAATANRLIDAINALSGLIISPAGYGRMTTDGKGGAVLDLSPIQETIAELNKKLNAIQSTNSAAADLGPLVTGFNSLVASINSSTLAVECHGDGTITATLTFPDMPAPIPTPPPPP